MKKIVIIFLSLISTLLHAEIKVEVYPSQVTLGETFQITLTQENSQNGGIPDLTVLQQDFAILGTERNVSYSVINGQSQSASQWVVALKPQKSGILTIPAIKVGSDQSAPLTINVQNTAHVKTVQTDTSRQQDVFLIADADQQKPFINQQILYTVRVFNSKRLLDAEYQGPQVEDALLIPLGDTRRYQTLHNNTNYIVEEQNYAIFPQKSGTLTITSPVFSALTYEINPEQVKAQDKPLQLTVQPIPKQYKSANWLPAKQVKLSEVYENTEQTIEEGSTITRTVTLEGTALPAQLLPSLNFTDEDSFKVYPEKGKDRNQVIKGELVSSTEMKITYLFNKAGKVTIPEIKLAWFNTRTGKPEFATLPPRSMHITPAAVSSKKDSSPNKKEVILQTKTEVDNTSSITNSWAWIAALLFASAWVITIGLWFWQKRSRTQGRGQYKTALAELSKACSECNPSQARDALLKWAALHWPDAPLLNLTDLTQLVRDAHLKKQLNQLSQVLYRSEQKTLWRGDELLRSVMALSKTKPGKTYKSSTLPPINPF